jgi:general secretion pathway protein M
MTLAERWAAFSPRERYLVVAAALVSVVVVVRYSPLWGFRELQPTGEDDRWVQLQKIENYQKILAREKFTQDQGEALRSRYEQSQQRLIEGATATQVGAELQGRLSSMATDSGLNVLSSQILKEEEIDGYRRVGVRLTLSGALDGVTRLLSSIETGPTSLAVTHVEINRKLGASRRPTAATARTTGQQATATEPLTATMEIKTFLRAAP